MNEQTHINTVTITVEEYDRLRLVDEAKTSHNILESRYSHYDEPKYVLITFDEALDEVVKLNESLGQQLAKLDYAHESLISSKESLQRKFDIFCSSGGIKVDITKISLWKFIKIKLGWA